MNMSTEKIKMFNGELFNGDDPLLLKEQNNAKQILMKYNKTKPNQVNKRKYLLTKLFNSFESPVYIEPPFYCDFGYNITLGKDFYANYGCVILDCNKIRIGDFVQFGPYVQVYSASHPVDPELRLSMKVIAKEINIGNNVWIGGNTVICPGVTIGDNTTIGAGSVVTKNIPSNVVAAGNPCRIIKKC